VPTTFPAVDATVVVVPATVEVEAPDVVVVTAEPPEIAGADDAGTVLVVVVVAEP